ncbi:hypothetical protein NFI96_021120, partial [Prochilodus magdalenae]
MSNILIEISYTEYRMNLISLMRVSTGCTLENRDQTLNITAYTGGSVLLPCSCTDLQTTPEELRWKRPVGNTWVEMPIRSGQYRNRVQLVNDHSPGNLSLLISHLTEEDGGDYMCAVKGSHIRIRLTLKGCTLEIREPLLTITAPTGGSVLLPCSCTDLQTTPEEFSWRKYIRNTQTLKEISSESSQYRNRVQLFNDHSPGNLSLLISHLTEEDGGVLQCAVKGSHIIISLTIEEGTPTPTPSTTSKPTTTTTAKPTPSTAPKPTPSTEVVNVHTSPTTATTHSSPSADGCTLENSAQQLQDKQPLRITAHTGGSVLLPCSCTDLQTQPEELRWKRPNGNTWVEMPINSDQYRNRLQLFNDLSPGNLSLLISHLTEGDGGDYQCYIKVTHVTIRLTVKEGPPKPPPKSPTKPSSNAPTTLTSTPSTEKTNGCTLENSTKTLDFTAHTGGSVLLPCSCTNLQTIPKEFSWKKDKINTQEWVEIFNATDQYRNRVQLFNDHSPGNLSLLISHLTEEDGGVYQCDVKGSYIYIRLTVEEPVSTTPTSPPVVNSNTSPTKSNTSPSPKPSDTDHSILFILIPVLLLLLGLGGVIYWRYRGRGRGQTESQEQRMIKKDEQKTQISSYCRQSAGIFSVERAVQQELAFKYFLNLQMPPPVVFSSVSISLLAGLDFFAGFDLLQWTTV